MASTSRLTVEGDLFNEAAINRIDQFAASPREISSRSAKVNRSAARVRGAGRIPPLRCNKPRTVDSGARICLDSTFTA